MCNACQISDVAAEAVRRGFSSALPDGPGGAQGRARYDGRGAKSPQWWPSRYGADDELGAGNELTQDRTLSAIGLVQEGRVIELGRNLDENTPIWNVGGRIFHMLTTASNQLEAMAPGWPDGNRASWLEEQVTQVYHIGTHLDGLGHFGIDGRYYNGHHYKDIYTPTGLKKLGIENTRPWINRGVLLNIAKVVGVDMLDEGFLITPDHLQAACVAQDVEVRPGDSVLLHTGYGALWGVDNKKYHNFEPGLGVASARWLMDRRITLVGSDTWTVEVLPSEDMEQAPYVVHQIVITEHGAHLLENVKTDELAATGRSEFLFLMLPLKIKGATASMVRPVAVL